MAPPIPNKPEIIANEVKAAVHSSMKELSPRKRKMKRSRTPVIHDSDSVQTDPEFTIPNKLFEEQLTTQPDSPLRDTNMADCC